LIKIKNGSHGSRPLPGVSLGVSELISSSTFRTLKLTIVSFDKLTVIFGGCRFSVSGVGEAVPLIAALLSIPTGDRYPPLDLTPQKRKEKTLKALMAQVEGLAARRPVLMVVEDAHWSDPTSLELLDLTVDRVPSLPVLLIVT
jgi:hypothetical protein